MAKTLVELVDGTVEFVTSNHGAVLDELSRPDADSAMAEVLASLQARCGIVNGTLPVIVQLTIEFMFRFIVFCRSGQKRSEQSE